MAYNPKTWKDNKTGGTPIKASDLNRMEQGIANAVEKNSDAVLTNIVSRNLFNKNEGIVQNSNIDAAGTISTNATTFYQKTYISVKPNTKYTVSSANNAMYRIAEYDNSKTFIKRTYNASASTKYTIVTSSTTKFIRLAIDNSVNIDTVMFAEGDDTNYTPYLNLQELQESQKTITLWTGSSLATPITLSDNPSNYRFFLVKTDKGYKAIVPAIEGGSTVAGRSVMESSAYVRYDIYFYITSLNPSVKTIQFTPTFIFKNGAYNNVANIVEIVGIN